jgi:hypothetical protein
MPAIAAVPVIATAAPVANATSLSLLMPLPPVSFHACQDDGSGG